MKAAVWTGYGTIMLDEVAEPSPKAGEVKIKVMSAGVCITDLHVYTGKFSYGRPPHILGHEIAGVVSETGKGVVGWETGQRVTVETSIGCGYCDACTRGERHLCPDMSEIGFAPHAGGYAQYLCVPADNLIPIPDTVSFDEAGILECAVCPAGSLMRLGIGFGETVVVLGVGAAGLAYIQMAKLLGAGRVIAIGRTQENLERSRRFGADEVINTTHEDAVQRVRELTGGTEADLVIEAAGAKGTIEAVCPLARTGGRVILYGIPEDREHLAFPVREIITRQLSVFGTVGNPQVWKPLLHFVAQGRFNLKEMVTHTFPLEEINQAFRMVEERQPGLIKAVVHPWEGEL